MHIKEGIAANKHLLHALETKNFAKSEYNGFFYSKDEQCWVAFDTNYNIETFGSYQECMNYIKKMNQ